MSGLNLGAGENYQANKSPCPLGAHILAGGSRQEQNKKAENVAQDNCSGGKASGHVWGYGWGQMPAFVHRKNRPAHQEQKLRGETRKLSD